MTSPGDSGQDDRPLDLVRKVLGPSIVTQAFGLGVAFIAQVTIARAIDSAEFGIYSFAIAIVSAAAIISRFGWDSTILRYGAGKSGAQLQGLLSFAGRAAWVRSSMVISLVALLGGIAIALNASRLSLGALGVCVLMIPIVAQLGLRQSALLVAGRVWAGLLPEYVLRPSLLLAGGCVLLWMNSADATIALLVTLGAATVALIAGITLLRRDSRLENLAPGELESDHLEWSANSSSTIRFNGAYQLLAYADILIAGFALPANELGFYAAARALATIATFALVAMQGPIGPSFARAIRDGDLQRVTGVARAVTRVAVLYALLYGLGLLILGRLTLSLFGDGFETGYAALLVLLAAQLLNSSAGPLGSIVTMWGLQKEASWAYVAATAVLFVSAMALSPQLGAVGIACAVVLATATWTIALNRLLLRRAGFSTWIVSPGFRSAPAGPDA